MSLNRKKELREVAKVACRDLRKNSTRAEKIFWEAVRNKKLNGMKFYRQHPLFYDITGVESFFVVDFYCHEKKLAIKLDGNYHHYRLRADTKRTEILHFLGVKILRFKIDEVTNNLNDVLNKVNKYFSIKKTEGLKVPLFLREGCLPVGRDFPKGMPSARES